MIVYLSSKILLHRKLSDTGEKAEFIDEKRCVKEGISLEEFLCELCAIYNSSFKSQVYDPGNGELCKDTMIVLNGHHLSLLANGINTILKEGDHLSILPVVAGG